MITGVILRGFWSPHPAREPRTLVVFTDRDHGPTGAIRPPRRGQGFSARVRVPWDVTEPPRPSASEAPRPKPEGGSFTEVRDGSNGSDGTAGPVPTESDGALERAGPPGGGRRTCAVAPHHRRTIDRAVAATRDIDLAARFAVEVGTAELERAVGAAERAGATAVASQGRRALRTFKHYERAAAGETATPSDDTG